MVEIVLNVCNLLWCGAIVLIFNDPWGCNCLSYGN